MKFKQTLNVLANYLPLYQRMVIHGACVKYKDIAILFSGNRGVGKTYLANCLVANDKEVSSIINGDKTILHFTDDLIFAYGSPWCGKEGVNQNDFAPLKAIIIIEKRKSLLNRLPINDAFDLIIHQTHLPMEYSTLAITINMLEKLIEKTPIYRLGIGYTVTDDTINTIKHII